jgi:hypothetical protein
MKLLKILFFLLIFPIVGLIVESCSVDNMRCKRYTYYSCSTSSLSLSQIENLSGDHPPAKVENRPTLKGDYGMAMLFDVERHEDSVSQQIAKLRFIQAAYADAPQCDYYHVKDTVVAVQIFSNKDFSISDSVSVDVTNNFKVWGWNDERTPIAEHLRPYEYSSSLNCVLVSPPAAAGTYTFTVVAQLSDGRKLEQSIEAVLR